MTDHRIDPGEMVAGARLFLLRSLDKFCAIIVTVEGIQAGLLFARKALHLRPSCYSLDKNGKHSGGAFCV